jgi:hypothetical protein
MVLHAINKRIDGLVRHVADSKACAHINSRWLDFVSESCNVRLGLVADGVNPYGEKRNSWSTWPILLFNYNLPPWLVTKKFFVMLVFFIPSKEFVKIYNFDVYMAPLIEEL